MINEDLLLSFGAEIRSYDSEDIIFSEGEIPVYYYYITKGKIKLNNYNEAGKEFIQGIFSKNHSLGLTSLFTEKRYPVNAVTVEASEVLRLPKAQFLDVLKQNPDHYPDILHCISEYMYYKYLMMQSMAFQNPSGKLLTLMDYLKFQHDDKSQYSLQIPLTRQQLASLTGLSVETVIRVIKNLEKQDVLKIQNRKIYY